VDCLCGGCGCVGVWVGGRVGGREGGSGVVHLQDKVTPSTKTLWPGASFQNRSY
jgi:hypothetical protein